MASPGSREARTAKRKLRQKLSALSLSCYAQKASGLPLSYATPAALKPRVAVYGHPRNACVTPMANPARRMRRALFLTLRKASKAIHL